MTSKPLANKQRKEKTVKPDAIFSNPRLAEIYDAFDGERHDLPHYLSIVKDKGAKSILDIGCGTGSFACLLSKEGLNVIGIDPAEASLEIAKQKKYADEVKWVLGDITTSEDFKVDLAIMTGNVAQVFLTDDDWYENLNAIGKRLHSNSHFIFEVRNPEQKAWLNWTKDKTYTKLDIPNIGVVEGWCEITDITDELVSFQWSYVFESDNSTLTSESTLRFRNYKDIEASLIKSGFLIEDVRDAPDRPNQEFVFITRKP
ncbi:MAG: class I SAM-dependent methyltransferase [Alphaproteobacteria bacterium]|nr:class I SAM-dependent methyltransferase [Alphaproteobacteria bacterium]